MICNPIMYDLICLIFFDLFESKSQKVFHYNYNKTKQNTNILCHQSPRLCGYDDNAYLAMISRFYLCDAFVLPSGERLRYHGYTARFPS